MSHTPSSGRRGVPVARRYAAVLVAAAAAIPTLALQPGAATADGVSTSSSASPVTVAAPGAGADATITVSRTGNLVNQAVTVRWAGFRPSSASQLDNVGDSFDVNTANPVRVYQCRGDSAVEPASSSDCYGSPGFRGIEASGDQPAVPEVPPFTYPGQQDRYDALPDGAANWQDTVTAPDGTGEVTLQLFTRRESPALGCDGTRPCSLVVVPNYGRPQGATEDQLDAPWAWERRTVIPLHFLPVSDACPLTGESVRVVGSPVSADAFASWRAKTCILDTAPVRIDYTTLGEPAAREDVAAGTTDVALTTEAVDAAARRARGIVVSPVGVTGLVVAFQIDDRNGKQVRKLRLNARLVAKIITASYRAGGSPTTAGNPANLFRDREFLALNPDVLWPSGSPGNRPLLLGDISDTTLALTRWIASDADARAFIAGKPDPYGMKVNTAYRGLALPFDRFPLLDQSQTSTFAPIQELDAVARQLSIAQPPGAVTTVEDGVNVVSKPPRQTPGRRAILGFVDAASAQRFQLTTASLRNSAGVYVGPTTPSLLAGIARSRVGADGVSRVVDLSIKDPAVYPLSMLVTAAISTKASADDRVAIARLLDYVAVRGQSPGDTPGTLPAGYAPLTTALVAQVRSAQRQVVAGKPDAIATPAPTPTPSPSATSSGGPTSTGGGAGPTPTVSVTTPAASPVPSSGPTVPSTVVADRLVSLSATPPAPVSPVLPLVLVGGLVALVAGPLLLLLDRSGRGPAWLRR